MFTRLINNKLLNRLQQEPLFQKLLFDVKGTGDVFPAIRNGYVDFYHKKQNLFSYDKKGFNTHIKYASGFKIQRQDYITEAMLEKLEKIDNFTAGYEMIKKNCALYSNVEAKGVSEILKNNSFARDKSKNLKIIVLDIETAFQSMDPDKTQDRIDILLVDKEKERLIFCEAKDFSNNELFANSGETPRVIGQIAKYTGQIKDRHEEILNAYKNYIKTVNELFNLKLHVPKSVCPSVPLIIFGYDKDQLKGPRFKATTKILKEDKIYYYSEGNPAGINLEDVVKKFK